MVVKEIWQYLRIIIMGFKDNIEIPHDLSNEYSFEISQPIIEPISYNYSL